MSAAPIEQLLSEAMRRHQAGQLVEAEAQYRQVLNQAPQYADAMQMLGVLLCQSGRSGEGEGFIRRAISLNPAAPNYYSNLGFALAGAGRHEEAIECYRRAIALSPQTPKYHKNLGSALFSAGRCEEAWASLQTALALSPSYPEAHFTLGNVFQDQNRPQEAAEAYRRAVLLRPEYAQAWHNLGLALRDLHRFDEAVECYRKAESLGLEGFELYSNLGTALKDMGQLDEALLCYRRSLSLKADAVVESNLLSTLHFHPDSTPQSLRDAHRRWNEVHARPLFTSIRPHENDRTPERGSTGSPQGRLRIGYVSPDFRNHPVGYFLLPLLANHDHRQFEVFCYSDVRRADAVTEQLRALADVWRETRRLNHEQLAEQVRADRIDILVDLMMHMAGSRLLAFARKPAPVQITYLAYCSTTGLETMDYRLSDPYLDPPGADESVYAEKTIRLPRTYWCYRVPAEAPEVGPPPCDATGHVTFGCLNNYCKVTPPTWRAWCEVLRTVPNSRLIVHVGEGKHHERAHELLLAEGIDAARLEFAGFHSLSDYFRLYQRIDIALDPFPYGGGTTTCDALWMGVPVVSLAGQTAVSRAGLSILSNVGLPELVAYDVDQYVEVARELASDRPRLCRLRATLRQRMLQSPLMDAPRFARDIEAAFRDTWRHWCDAPSRAENTPEAHYDLGNVLQKQRQFEPAIDAYRRAVALRPQHAEAWHNLGSALGAVNRFDEAVDCYRQAQSLGFDRFELHANLGTALKGRGELDESLNCFRRALSLKADAGLESILLCTLHLDPESTPQSLSEAHRHWNDVYARPLAGQRFSHTHPTAADSARPLRIGYVSAYFNSRPVGRFLSPLLANHDHSRFQAFCYCDCREPDAATETIRGWADVWRDTVKLSDAQLAEQVQRDRIDILIDLGMHTRGNRMLAFARKPAPVQVTYLAYCGTTGLETMDYRLSDLYLDPPSAGSGQADDHDRIYCSERTVRLNSYWCYPAPPDAPPVNELPFATSGIITFGCLNDFTKVNPASLSLWAKVLCAVPRSRLLLHSPGGAPRSRITAHLQAAGVEAGRVQFAGMLPMAEYFQQYQQIDIALDPTPWPGGTTTCDALWMGVPVVSLAGKTAISRGGLSILSNIGLGELVAREAEQYVRIATDLAADRPRLTQLRANLRQRMQSSPLMDAPRFARDVEAAYQTMWQTWCGFAHPAG